MKRFNLTKKAWIMNLLYIILLGAVVYWFSTMFISASAYGMLASLVPMIFIFIIIAVILMGVTTSVEVTGDGIRINKLIGSAWYPSSEGIELKEKEKKKNLMMIGKDGSGVKIRKQFGKFDDFQDKDELIRTLREVAGARILAYDRKKREHYEL